MKARNIITGWPRGTSTSKPYPDHPFDFPWGMNPIAYDAAMLEDERDSDRRYHETQARMMEQWRTKTGQFAPPDASFMHLYMPVKGFQP